MGRIRDFSLYKIAQKYSGYNLSAFLICTRGSLLKRRWLEHEVDHTSNHTGRLYLLNPKCLKNNVLNVKVGNVVLKCVFK
jgi:hypothetical protein